MADQAPLPASLRDWLGDIDIYLLDQVLRGRIRTGMSILDAGCGGGRNLAYFLILSGGAAVWTAEAVCNTLRITGGGSYGRKDRSAGR